MGPLGISVDTAEGRRGGGRPRPGPEGPPGARGSLSQSAARGPAAPALSPMPAQPLNSTSVPLHPPRSPLPGPPTEDPRGRCCGFVFSFWKWFYIDFSFKPNNSRQKEVALAGNCEPAAST